MVRRHRHYSPETLLLVFDWPNPRNEISPPDHLSVPQTRENKPLFLAQALYL